MQTAFTAPLSITQLHQRLPSSTCRARARGRTPCMVQTSTSTNKRQARANTNGTTNEVKNLNTPTTAAVTMPTTVVLGLSHHTATVDVRERLAVPEAEWAAAARELCQLESISEAAVLSTCNRFEVYLVTKEPYAALQAAVAHLSERSGLTAGALRRHLFMQVAQDAVWHILRVSAGLDSLVVGEGQILSQVKKCYEIATAKNGSAGKVLSRFLNTAVSAGKRVRSETAIAKGAVSISSAAVELAGLHAPADVGAELENCQVAIIGAGKMARLLVQHLAARGSKGIIIVNRSRPRAEELAKQFPDAHLQIQTMETLQNVLKNAQVVFTSTGSADPVVTRQILEAPECRAQQPDHALMLVDISVPRNVSADASDAHRVHSYNVDDLKAVVAKNQARRRRVMVEAEGVLREEHSAFKNWLSSLGCIPCISKLQTRAEEIRQDELERVRGKLAGLSASEKKAVEALSKGIINKMLHSPMVHLRGLQDMEERTQTLRNIEALFKL